MSRRTDQKNILNAIRLTLLDWDPMDLFSLGAAGLEEYDEYIVPIAKALATFDDDIQFTDFLYDFAMNQMEDAQTTREATKIAAEKLIKLM